MRTVRTAGRIRAASIIVLLWASPALEARHASAGTGHFHPPSETPGSRDAVLFSPFSDMSREERNFVRSKVQDHNYAVTEYVDNSAAGPLDDDPGQATAANFKHLSQKGIVYIATHGGFNADRTAVLMVEAYASVAAQIGALIAYTTPLPGGPPPPFGPLDLAACHAGQPIVHGICITAIGVRNHFRDNRTIVHVAACNSYSFRLDFNAREFFGYEGTVCQSDAVSDTKLVWGRMHGSTDSGARRAASQAYLGGGFGTNFRYRHPPNTYDTVLSPAVMVATPMPTWTLDPGGSWAGDVEFDTFMDTTVDPASVVTATGCAHLIDQGWGTSRSIHFNVIVTGIGTATFTVHQAQARAARAFQNNMDGNQNPAGSDHVGPNRDDHVWSVPCALS